MAKSTSSTPAGSERQDDEVAESGPELNGSFGNNGAVEALEFDYNELLSQASAWIEENQTLAILGGFGFGVFIGVLLRR